MTHELDQINNMSFFMHGKTWLVLARFPPILLIIYHALYILGIMYRSDAQVICPIFSLDIRDTGMLQSTLYICNWFFSWINTFKIYSLLCLIDFDVFTLYPFDGTCNFLYLKFNICVCHTLTKYNIVTGFTIWVLAEHF